MKKAETVNVFTDGLVMDLNPIVTPNNVVSNALNATLITMNGNENALQNDMGNGRVETAFLPEGYVPVGTAELGGIIYIVSYNPLIDKCQIGSFPSPERNITSSELESPEIEVTNPQFQIEDTSNKQYGKIINTILKVKLLSSPDKQLKLSPGDKYVIYSSNTGITNNINCISDVGNPNHIIDDDPRNVTIHVVSIGDDGKIVYLDDSLKWTDDTGTPKHYYIREVNEGDDIKTDIDSYRSLVSSAYNIFNSKVSGELALLFELKVIDTFSLTWDANVSDIDDSTYNKQATIIFNINYTSSHPNINMRYSILTDSQIDGPLSCNIKQGWYSELSDSDYSGRNNDGNDKDIPIKVGDFKYNSDTNLTECIWSYQITPAMSFGYLEYLATRGSINFLEIGSGKIELDEWRYYIENDNFYLNWGLEAYPEKNKKITKVVFTFIPFDKINSSSVTFDNTKEPSNEFPQYTVSGKTSYSGYFQENIDFGNNSRVQNGTLQKDYLYLVDVCVYYGSIEEMQYRHNYKFLYTTGQWNDVYIEGMVRDFTTLTLQPKFTGEYSTIDNIQSYIQTQDSNIEIPETFDEENPQYAAMGAKVTTVNYIDNKFQKLGPTASVNLIIKCAEYQELFNYEEQAEDTYLFSLEKSNIELSNDAVPISERPSSIAEYVNSKIAQPNPDTITMADDFDDTVYTVLTEGIKNSEIDNAAIDSFEVDITSYRSNFDLDIYGAIFSRINADLIMDSVVIDQFIRPLLYYTSGQDSQLQSYNGLGLSSFGNFNDVIHISQRDRGRGSPFEWTLSTDTGEVYETNESMWNPGEEVESDYWWVGEAAKPYNDYILPYFTVRNAFFGCCQWSGGPSISDNYTKFGRTAVTYYYGLWARIAWGDSYFMIPINTFGQDPSSIARFLSSLFVSIYYTDGNSTTRWMAVVDNINYLSSYIETWNLEISSKVNVQNILNNVTLKTSSNNTLSLQYLQDLCKSISQGDEELINTNNLNITNFTNPLSLQNYNYSHSFQINNESLYDLFNRRKSNHINSYYVLSTEEQGHISNTGINPLRFYVYNPDAQIFQQLNSSTAQYTFSRVDSYNDTINANEGTDSTRVLVNEYTLAKNDVAFTPTNIYNYLRIEDKPYLDAAILNNLNVKMYFQTKEPGKDNESTIGGNSGEGFSGVGLIHLLSF